MYNSFRDHDGFWEVFVRGKCNENDRRNKKKRKKRQVVVFPGSANPGTGISGNVNPNETIVRRRGQPSSRRSGGKLDLKR